MSTLVGEVKALYAAGKQAKAIIKNVEFDEALQARFDESAAQVTGDMIQVVCAVIGAFIAHALRRPANDEEVQRFLAGAAGDPAFPARAFRLVGELRKAASHRRRAFLAAMLFGLPFTKIPDDERDRIDMAVERMMVPDVEFLAKLAEKRKRMGPELSSSLAYLFGPSGLAALIRGNDLRIATPNEWRGGFEHMKLDRPEHAGDRSALASLESLGCLVLGQSQMSSKEWKVHHLVVTPLGDAILRALDEIRPGLEVPAAPRRSVPAGGRARRS